MRKMPKTLGNVLFCDMLEKSPTDPENERSINNMILIEENESNWTPRWQNTPAFFMRDVVKLESASRK